MHPNVCCGTIYNGQDLEAMKMAINRGMDREDMVYIYKGRLVIRKNNVIYSNMDESRDYHTKLSKYNSVHGVRGTDMVSSDFEVFLSRQTDGLLFLSNMFKFK